jgi:RNA polymerase sigma factor (TIGR02999 family)
MILPPRPEAEISGKNRHGDSEWPPMAEGSEITELLQAWSAGNENALAKLVPRVQRELHRLAGRFMAGERVNHPLQTTALINEAYIRLIGWNKPDWQNREQFFAVCAQLMRRILVDMARTKNAAAKKQGARETMFDEAFTYRPANSRDLLRLDEALNALAEIDERKTRVIELRFFAGLSVEETAAVLQISDRTVLREWNLAKAWLYREIRKM